MSEKDYRKMLNPWFVEELTFPNMRVQTRVLDKSVDRISTRAGGLEFSYHENLNPKPTEDPVKEAPKINWEKRDQDIKEDMEAEKTICESAPADWLPINKDNSYVLLQDKYAAMLRLARGNVMLKAASSMTIGAQQELQIESSGRYQLFVGYNSNEYRKGNSRFLYGRQDSKHIESLKNIHKVVLECQLKRLTEMSPDYEENVPAPLQKDSGQNGEEIDCPVCNTPLLADLYSVTGAVLGFRGNVWDFAPTDFSKGAVLRQYNHMTYEQVSRTSIAARLKREGCGSRGCKEGKYFSYMNLLKNSDELGKDHAKKVAEAAGKEEGCGGQGSDTSYGYSGDVTMRIGAFMSNLPSYAQTGYHVFPLKFELPLQLTDFDELIASRAGLILSSTGSARKVTYAEPPISGPGSLSIEVGQKFTTLVGHTYDLIVNGRTYIKSGSIDICATEGEASLTSENVTTVRGHNILLDAYGGIHVKSDSTFINGAFNVSGDSAFKGHVTTDGAISCPYLIMPSMTQTSSWNGSGKRIDHFAQWATEPPEPNNNKCDLRVQFQYDDNGDIDDYRIIESQPTTGSPAFVTAVRQLEYDMNTKYKYKIDWFQYFHGCRMFSRDISYIMAMAYEQVEDYPVGYVASGGSNGKSFSPRMAEIANNPANVAKYPELAKYKDGMVPSFGGGGGNVYLYKHHHLRWGEAHDHESSMPVGSYTQSTFDWGFERTAGSAAATPHPIKGDGLGYGRGAKGYAKFYGSGSFRVDEDVEFLAINVETIKGDQDSWGDGAPSNGAGEGSGQQNISAYSDATNPPPPGESLS